MKKIYLSLFICCVGLLINCREDKKEIWVLDQANMLTATQINKLDSLYKAHEKITSNEISLIITDSLLDSSISKSATDLGNKYGVGKKESNNGVVILVCPPKHQVAIATGYGTEKILKNEIAKKIIDSLMIPRFSEGKFFEAVWDGSIGITQFLELPGNKIKPKP